MLKQEVENVLRPSEVSRLLSVKQLLKRENCQIAEATRPRNVKQFLAYSVKPLTLYIPFKSMPKETSFTIILVRWTQRKYVVHYNKTLLRARNFVVFSHVISYPERLINGRVVLSQTQTAAVNQGRIWWLFTSHQSIKESSSTVTEMRLKTFWKNILMSGNLT